MAPVRAESLKVVTEFAMNSSLKIFLTVALSSLKQNIYIFIHLDAFVQSVIVEKTIQNHALQCEG